MPPSFSTTIVALLTWIRRHPRIHDFCLHVASVLGKFPGGRLLVRAIQDAQGHRRGTYAEWIARYDTLDDSDRRAIAAHIPEFPFRPTFSVIMPVVTADAASLREGIDSALRQLYPASEICIATGSEATRSSSVTALLTAVAEVDPRVTITRVVDDDDAAAVANAALKPATGDFVVLFDPRNLLSETALYELAAAVTRDPDADILFSDEDSIDIDGRRSDPVMKTAWSAEMMLTHDMVGDLTAVRRRLLSDIGGFRTGFAAAGHHDLVLRASEATAASRILHLPLVLHHSRPGTRIDTIDSEARLRAVGQHLARTGQTGVRIAPMPGAPGWLEVRRAVPSPPPLVSIIVPTRDRADILEPCLEGLLNATEYPCFEVIIADNDSRKPETFLLFERLASDTRVRILSCPGPFNYSAINNRAVAESRGEILLLLNNDVRIRHADWLSAMVAQAVRPDVGAVGARLLYDNGTIQHAGVVLGVGAIAPVAGHVYERAAGDTPGHLNHLRIARTMSAVTAACMALRRHVFDEVGGFDEKHLPVAFNDVDLCLKITARGYQIIWTPQAELTHLESASRGSDLRAGVVERFQRDISHMQRTWGDRIRTDPHYGPNFNKVALDYSLAFPPQRQKTWSRRASGAASATTAPDTRRPMPVVHGPPSHACTRYAVLHIPKTAGTTLRLILSEAFPDDVFPSKVELIANGGEYLTYTAMKGRRDWADARRIVMGHYTLGELLSLFPDRQIITCIREPFARTCSVIGHHHRQLGIDVEDLLADPTFLMQHVINKQTRCLVSDHSAKWTVDYSESKVDEALQQLDRMCIVGLQHRFPQFIARVAAEVGIPQHIGCDRHENVAPSDIDDEVAPFSAQIRELIAGDLELYRQACSRAGSPRVP